MGLEKNVLTYMRMVANLYTSPRNVDPPTASHLQARRLPRSPDFAAEKLEGLSMSLVNISIVGNLAKAPEQTCFASGKVKTTLIVACNSPHRGKSGERQFDKADFYKVEFWGKLAELTHKYLSKGNQVGVSGRLVFDYWQDKQGQQRMTPVVEATQIALPPRLRVVKDDEQPMEEVAQNIESTNPLVGEMTFSEADAEELLGEREFESTAMGGVDLPPALGGHKKTAVVR